MARRNYKRDSKGRFASTTHTAGKASGLVTGSFKKHPKRKKNPLLPQKNKNGETTYAKAGGGRITQAEAAARIYGRGSKQHMAVLRKSRKRKRKR